MFQFINYNFQCEKHLVNLHFVPKANQSLKDLFLPPEIIADNLVQHTSIISVKFNTINRSFYIYREQYNYYIELNEMTLHAMLSDFLNKLIREKSIGDMTIILNYNLIQNIILEFKSHYLLHITIGNVNTRFLSFTNGSLDLVSLKQLPRKVKVFTTNFIASNFLFEQRYLSYNDIGFFKYFLETIFQKNMEYIYFIRAMLKRMLIPITTQKIVFFVGLAGTGKSALTNILIRCLGESNVLITNLNQLRENVFEKTLLRNKKLLLFNDISFKSEADIQFLLALSGSDLAPGRRKYSMEEIQIDFSGLILIVCNKIPVIHDSMNAFSRRMIVIPFMHKVAPEYRKVLLSKLPAGDFSGPIGPEVGNIINWGLSCPNDIVDLFFNRAYTGGQNILLGDKYYFIKLFILCYLFYTNSENDLVHTCLKGSKHDSLGIWPKFLNFAIEQNLNLNELMIKPYDFLNDFQQSLSELHWNNCSKKRIAEGYCFTYLQFYNAPKHIEFAYQKIKQIQNQLITSDILPMEYIKQKYPHETDGQDLFYVFSEKLRSFKPLEILHLASQSRDLLDAQATDIEAVNYFKETDQLIQNAEFNLKDENSQQREKLFNKIESPNLENKLMEITKLQDQLVLLDKPDDKPNDKSNDKPNDKPDVVKRPRGRPRKNLDNKPDMVKRPRGRPRKNSDNKPNH